MVPKSVWKTGMVEPAPGIKVTAVKAEHSSLLVWRNPATGKNESHPAGEAVGYALNSLEDRGVLFVRPQDKIYEGMIIGENAKPDDLEVNPMKSKQLTNFRSTGKDDAIRLTPPRIMTLEQAIAYIDDDEMVEVTPKSIRLQKIPRKPVGDPRRVTATG